MSKLVSNFLDRLAERLTALIASTVSSRMAVLQAQVQADQQSQLEDLAHQYEAAGKLGIATKIRERAQLLTSPELAGEGETLLDRLGSGPAPRLASLSDSSAADLRSLPDFRQSAAKQRRKRAFESPLDSTTPCSLDNPGNANGQEAQQ